MIYLISWGCWGFCSLPVVECVPWEIFSNLPCVPIRLFFFRCTPCLLWMLLFFVHTLPIIPWLWFLHSLFWLFLWFLWLTLDCYEVLISISFHHKALRTHMVSTNTPVAFNLWIFLQIAPRLLLLGRDEELLIISAHL